MNLFDLHAQEDVNRRHRVSEALWEAIRSYERGNAHKASEHLQEALALVGTDIRLIELEQAREEFYRVVDEVRAAE